MYAIRSYYGVISRFIAEHPGVQVSLDSQSVENARDMVALRAVDCGFAKLPVDYPGLAYDVITSYSIHYTKLYERQASASCVCAP